jgi:hypothetical protein
MINESKNLSVKNVIFVLLEKIEKMIKLDEKIFLIIG